MMMIMMMATLGLECRSVLLKLAQYFSRNNNRFFFTICHKYDRSKGHLLIEGRS